MRISGPFEGCHDFLDPSGIFDTCVTDVCAMTDKETALCTNVRLYVQKCIDAGGSPGNWWETVTVCGRFCFFLSLVSRNG